MLIVNYKSKSNQRGIGNVMVLVGVGIAAVLWCIFMGVMSYIGHSRQETIRKDREFFESRAPKKKVHVRREIKGYRLSY